MGTRLYPLTKNHQVLETLAGVPAGTAARYQELEAQAAEEKRDLYSIHLATQAAGGVIELPRSKLRGF